MVGNYLLYIVELIDRGHMHKLWPLLVCVTCATTWGLYAVFWRQLI